MVVRARLFYPYCYCLSKLSLPSLLKNYRRKLFLELRNYSEAFFSFQLNKKKIWYRNSPSNSKEKYLIFQQKERTLERSVYPPKKASAIEENRKGKDWLASSFIPSLETCPARKWGIWFGDFYCGVPSPVWLCRRSTPIINHTSKAIECLTLVLPPGKGRGSKVD